MVFRLKQGIVRGWQDRVSRYAFSVSVSPAYPCNQILYRDKIVFRCRRAVLTSTLDRMFDNSWHFLESFPDLRPALEIDIAAHVRYSLQHLFISNGASKSQVTKAHTHRRVNHQQPSGLLPSPERRGARVAVCAICIFLLPSRPGYRSRMCTNKRQECAAHVSYSAPGPCIRERDAAIKQLTTENVYRRCLFSAKKHRWQSHNLPIVQP